ncbi:MAG: CcmD family protein [Chthonomonadaceae bacterium]|nr:CcmD family protein [Chthonomonadaceae bacterium]
MENKLMLVMAVTLVTWLGLFAYLFYVDRGLRRLERRTQERDEL